MLKYVSMLLFKTLQEKVIFFYGLTFSNRSSTCYSLYLNNGFLLVIERSLLNNLCHSVVNFFKIEFWVLKN